MRSIRRAAIAGATAASLILGAASVASADEAKNPAVNEQGAKDNEGSSKIFEGSSDKDGKDNKDAKGTEGKVLPQAKGKDHCKSGEFKAVSSCIGDKLEADQPANGDRLFGSTSDSSKEPKWAQYMKVVTVVGLVGSFLGLVVFPAYNFAVANHLLPGQAPMPLPAPAPAHR